MRKEDIELLQSLANEVHELRETVQWQKTRPLIRINTKNLIIGAIILHVILESIILYICIK